MSGTARSILVFLFLAVLTPFVEAQNIRTPLVTVRPDSVEAKAILKAQVAWMKQGPGLPQISIHLSPLLIKRNDKYAYLVAHVSTSQPATLTNVSFLDAILELKDGQWVSDGYQGGKPKHGGSISDMCGYGDGVGPQVFKECKPIPR
jgi:hypothetical protein